MLDSTHRGPLARFAPGLGGLEEHLLPFLPVAGPRVWAGLLDTLIDGPDFEWLMIDSSYIRAHPYSAGAKGRNQSIVRTKGG